MREIRRFIGSKQDMVASDTEIPRALALLATDELRKLNYLIFGLAQQKELLHLIPIVVTKFSMFAFGHRGAENTEADE
jgi:hypothetical protein